MPQDPVVNNHDCGNRAQSAGVANQPSIDIPFGIFEQFPGHHAHADDAGDQPSRPKRDVAGEGIGEVIGRRDDICSDVHCQSRHCHRKHRYSYQNRLLEVPDQLHGVPQLFHGHARVNHDGSRRNNDAQRSKHRHRRRQCYHLPDRLFPLAASETREVRHVEGKRSPKSNHRRQGRHELGQELPKCVEFSLILKHVTESMSLIDSPCGQQDGHDQNKWRRQALHVFEQTHTLIYDEYLQPPEDGEASPLGNGESAQLRQLGNGRANHFQSRINGAPTNPCLDAEPTASNQRSHERRYIGADRAVTGARKDGEGNTVFGAWVRIQQDRNQYNQIAEQNGQQGLPPVHAAGYQPR